MALELLCCAISFYYKDFKSDSLICSSQVYWLEKCSEIGAMVQNHLRCIIALSIFHQTNCKVNNIFTLLF